MQYNQGMKITIYSMKVCPYCVKAKAILKQRGLSFEEIMIDDWSDDEWDAQEKRSGMKTVPQIYVGDKLIGGCSDLEALDQKDQLASLKG
jgi:glutaredoxin 3